MPYHQPGLSLTQWRGDPQFGLLVKAGLKIGGTLARKVATKLIRPSTAFARTAAGAGAVGVAAAILRGRGGRPGFPLPGGGRVFPGRALPGGKPFTTPGQCPQGFHVNKAVRAWEIAQEQGRDVKEPYWVNYCVKARRIDVANVRSLRRAARRGRGFVKTYRRVAAAFGLTRGRGRKVAKRR